MDNKENMRIVVEIQKDGRAWGASTGCSEDQIKNWSLSELVDRIVKPTTAAALSRMEEELNTKGR